ncbi:MAG: alpha/beta hydrolase [Chloroflexota bacterium]
MPDETTGARRWLRPLATGLALLGAILGVGYLVASYAVYDTLAAVSGECRERDVADTPQQFAIDGMDEDDAAAYAMPAPQDLSFRSRDERIANLTLRAWWIAGAHADGPAVILVHGWKGCRRDDNVLLPAGMLHRHGFGVLLIDQRDHGDSDDEDGRFAGGSEEYLDVLGAWDWLVAQGVPAERIGLLGMSFGASTSVIAGGEEPRVRAVWSDSSFADFGEAARAFLAHEGYPEVLEPGARLMARLVAGDDLAARSPLAEMARYAGRPLAIVHGAADDFLPWRFATELRAAAEAGGVDLREHWIVPGAGHARSVVEEPAAYERRLVAFFTGALGAP